MSRNDGRGNGDVPIEFLDLGCPLPPLRGRGAPPSPITLAEVPLPSSTWADHAVCRGTEPTLWFSTGTVPTEARDLCSTCPVRQSCLDYALTWKLDGVWAGTSKRQRDRMRSRQRKEKG